MLKNVLLIGKYSEIVYLCFTVVYKFTFAITIYHNYLAFLSLTLY